MHTLTQLRLCSPIHLSQGRFFPSPGVHTMLPQCAFPAQGQAMAASCLQGTLIPASLPLPQLRALCYACPLLSFLPKSHPPSGPGSNLLNFISCSNGATIFLLGGGQGDLRVSETVLPQNKWTQITHRGAFSPASSQFPHSYSPQRTFWNRPRSKVQGGAMSVSPMPGTPLVQEMLVELQNDHIEGHNNNATSKI